MVFTTVGVLILGIKLVYRKEVVSVFQRCVGRVQEWVGYGGGEVGAI